MNSIMKALSENPLQVALVENKDLRTQLAKANERVKELESIQAYSEETGFIDLNKFAIENQVKGAEALIYAFPLNACDQMREWAEQLRKEQE